MDVLENSEESRYDALVSVWFSSGLQQMCEGAIGDYPCILKAPFWICEGFQRNPTRFIRPSHGFAQDSYRFLEGFLRLLGGFAPGSFGFLMDVLRIAEGSLKDGPGFLKHSIWICNKLHKCFLQNRISFDKEPLKLLSWSRHRLLMDFTMIFLGWV